VLGAGHVAECRHDADAKLLKAILIFCTASNEKALYLTEQIREALFRPNAKVGYETTDFDFAHLVWTFTLPRERRETNRGCRRINEVWSRRLEKFVNGRQFGGLRRALVERVRVKRCERVCDSNFQLLIANPELRIWLDPAGRARSFDEAGLSCSLIEDELGMRALGHGGGTRDRWSGRLH
jgi:hypothetical protein